MSDRRTPAQRRRDLRAGDIFGRCDQQEYQEETEAFVGAGHLEYCAVKCARDFHETGEWRCICNPHPRVGPHPPLGIPGTGKVTQDRQYERPKSK